MKYGHEYDQALASADFPSHWVAAALSYRALKKCIKQVQRELEEFGLDAATLKTLNSSFGVHKAEDGSVADSQDGKFIPELWVAVDEDTGNFLHAGLTTTTKTYLHNRQNPNLEGHTNPPSEQCMSTPEEPPVADLGPTAPARVVWKQVPLTAAAAFFDVLEPALEELEKIQTSESHRLRSQILALGEEVAEATNPPADSKTKVVKMSRREMDVWRQLFELYLEQPIFFSTHERDSGKRSYDQAKSQLEHFSNTLVRARLASKFRSPASKVAFDNFIAINLDILRIMHFEQIISVAVRKILKKFDKRTALSASGMYRPSFGSGPLAKSIAQDMCGEISSKILAIVPQIDDYLCPVCCELAWKPVKLGCCNAVFCIRCVILLQRGTDHRCPMCRSASVMQADACKCDWINDHDCWLTYSSSYRH